MSEKFIKNWSIDIGQDRFAMFPPMFRFQLNDHFVYLPLKDIKDWFNEISDSRGNQSEKAIKAKKNLDSIFAELFHPFRDYSFLGEKKSES
jgi:hypothetical protein